MEALINAITAYFDVSVSGHTKLYDTIADKGAVFPYVVFNLIPGAPNDTLSESSAGEVGIETGIVQFNIYSDAYSIATAAAIKRLIHTAFDYVDDISITDWSLISFERGIGGRTKEVVNGEQVWTIMVQYEFTVGKD